MLLPLAVAFAAVAAGTWFAVGPREGTRTLKGIRLVALVASLGVVLTHLLPEAFHAVGFASFGAFAFGVALPVLIEKGLQILFQSRKPDASDLVSLEIGYAGLLAHRFGDGLTMGAVSPGEPFWARAAVVLAVAAHIVPVTTVMLLAVKTALGEKTAVVRGIGLAVSTMAGVVVAGLALAADPHAHAHGAHGAHGQESHLAAWISAVVAGLLVHIVVHDFPRVSSGDAAKN
jgi:hypothetical protein